jgi:hypothetical protein
MRLLLLGALDLFLGRGRGLLIVYGETGDGRINLGERDSHGWRVCWELGSRREILGEIRID